MPRLLRVVLCALLALTLLCGSGCAAFRSAFAPSHAHAHADGADVGGYAKVSSKGEIARWILIGTIITAVVFVDLLILPATYHDPFPCCRAVISCH